MFSSIFIAPVVVHFKTASNFIIALHVINGVKENERKGYAEDSNFDSLFEFLPCKRANLTDTL